MDARAEQIIAAIKALLIGLPTTGDNVQRGQVYPHEKGKLPALAIAMGADVPAAEYQTALLDWELTVIIESFAAIETDYTTMDSMIDTALNQIRKEVHAAVMADYKLGLAFVIDTTPGPAAAPLLDGDGAQPIGSQAITFVVRYRSDRNDISQ